MSYCRHTLIPRLVFSTALLLTLAAVPFQLAVEASFLVVSLPLLAIPAFGTLILAQRPDNAIGRLFLGAGLAIVVGYAAGTWAQYSVEVSPLPGTAWMALVSQAIVGPAWLLLAAFLLLLFPTGQLPSP